MKKKNEKKTQTLMNSQSDKKTKKRWIRRVGITLLLSSLVIGPALYVKHQYGAEFSAAVSDGYRIARSVDDSFLRNDEPTRVFDHKGVVIKELNAQAKLQVTNETVNPLLKDGFVAVEDKRFYRHHGVDLWSIMRAATVSIKGGATQGGSTITQQLVKNKVLKNSSITLSRKLKEAVIAQELEKRYSKDQLLVAYLNAVYFGHGANGVGSAAKLYFNKDQSELTPREAAVIIGITNNPTLYDPINNPDVSNKKTEEVLGKLYSGGVINKEQYEKALSEETVLEPTKLINNRDYSDNYAVSFAIRKAAEELMRLDGFEFKYYFESDEEFTSYKKAFAKLLDQKQKLISSGGYNLYTTIDNELQKELEGIVTNTLSPFTEKDPKSGKLNTQASMTVIDNDSHSVVAVVGGRGTEADFVNRAYQGYRQPGSTAKPIIAYTEGFENGLLPQTRLVDSQVPELPFVKNYSQVYSNKEYTIRDAVGWSLNTIALKVTLKHTNLDTVMRKLEAMEFAAVHPQDHNAISAIGGMTYGVTTTEVAGAYSTMVNGGVFVTPTNLESIESAYTKETLYTNPKATKKVWSKEAAYAMVDTLVSSADGPTTYDEKTIASNYPKKAQGGKTGTTDAYRDVYYAGINPYYTTAVWVGAESNRTLYEPERVLAKRISRLTAEKLLAGKKEREFKKPDTVIKNGDQLQFSSKETVTIGSSVGKSDYASTEQTRRDNEKQQQVERLKELSYRIVHGLSLKEEKEREASVEQLIESIESIKLENEKAYTEAFSELIKADELLKSVKKPSENERLAKRLKALELSIKERKALFDEQKARELELEKEKRIEKKQEELLVNNRERLKELEQELEKTKEAIIQEHKKGSSIDGLVNKLNETVSLIRKAGKPTQPDYTIIVKHDTVDFIEE